MNEEIAESVISSIDTKDKRRVLKYIMEHKECKRKDIEVDLNLTQTKTYWIVSKLVKAGVVTMSWNKLNVNQETLNTTILQLII